MTSYTSFVYSPFSVSGRITGLDTYCSNGNAHSACRGSHGFNAPVDIFQSVNPAAVFLRVTNCQSWVTRIYSSCCSSCIGYPHHQRIIVVDLYGFLNGCIYMGSVGYGHVNMDAQVKDGQLYNMSQYPLPFRLGVEANGSCPASAPFCSTNTHIHMEKKGGSRQSLSCNADVYSTTAIYRFTWDSNSPC